MSKAKRPTNAFLRAMAEALRQAEHRNVAEHLAAGMLWAMYPEWFTEIWSKRHEQS